MGMMLDEVYQFTFPLAADNAADPLSVPTYVDGNSEAVHPAVIDMSWEGVGSWNGYRYWMAFTPYEDGDNQTENPSIVASNDGTSWQVPDGLINPIDGPTEGVDYFSDPVLWFDADTSRLHLIYRQTGDGTDELWHRHSDEGTTWSAATSILSVSSGSERLLSPAVNEADGTFYLWTVDSVPTTNTLYLRTADDITGTYSARQETDLTAPSGKTLWHHTVVRRYGVWWLLGVVSEFDELFYARSNDGAAWTLEPSSLLGPGESGSWDFSLYHATWQPIAGGHWRVWYGSKGNTEAATPDWLVGVTDTRG